jgi:DNA-binding MarR family transcriptional regulator
LSDQAVVTPSQLVNGAPALRAFAFLVRAQAVATRRLNASLQAEHGLSINAFEALLVLSTAPEQRLKRVDLARRLLLTPSGVTRMLEGLERDGLVERAACTSDLRVTYAQLTDAGREKLEAASCGHSDSVRTLFEDHLAPEEIEALAEVLGKLPGVAYGEDACEPIVSSD